MDGVGVADGVVGVGILVVYMLMMRLCVGAAAGVGVVVVVGVFFFMCVVDARAADGVVCVVGWVRCWRCTCYY